MWVYPKVSFNKVDIGINRNLFDRISKIIELPEPEEVKLGRCETEWKLKQIDLFTALKICVAFTTEMKRNDFFI